MKKKTKEAAATEVKINSAYLPYLNCEKKLQIFFGGSSSGKSFFLAQRAVLDNLQGVNYLICRACANSLKKSIFNEITKAICSLGLGDYYKINKSELAITCLINKKQILFSGLDDAEKIKGITPIRGVVERIHIEEATEVDRGSFLQLKKRLRGLTKVQKTITLSFNPISKNHWIYKEFFKDWDESKKSYNGPDLSILKTTYKDNAFLEDEDKESLEKENDPYFYQVYTLGNFGEISGAILHNWQVQDLSEKKNSFNNYYCGLDFGFAADPTAFIKCAYEKSTKKVYILEEYFQKGMHNNERAGMLRQKLGPGYVSCDSASPELISDLCRQGIKALPATKGPGSVLAGIDFLKRQQIIIDQRCQNFINEISSWHWETDRQGNALERPVDRNNHGLDALRYALEPVLKRATVEAGHRL